MLQYFRFPTCSDLKARIRKEKLHGARQWLGGVTGLQHPRELSSWSCTSSFQGVDLLSQPVAQFLIYRKMVTTVNESGEKKYPKYTCGLLWIIIHVMCELIGISSPHLSAAALERLSEMHKLQGLVGFGLVLLSLLLKLDGFKEAERWHEAWAGLGMVVCVVTLSVGPGFSLRGCLVVELHKACEWVMVQIQALMQCSAGMLFDCPH